MANTRKCELCLNKFKKEQTFVNPFKKGLLRSHYLCSLCLDKVYSENGYYVYITNRGDRLYLDKKDDRNFIYFKNGLITSDFRMMNPPFITSSGEIDLKDMKEKMKKITDDFVIKSQKMLYDEAYQVYKEAIKKLGKEAKKISELKYLSYFGIRDEKTIVKYNITPEGENGYI